MVVICKRATKRLIKDHRYEVRNLWNSGTPGRRSGYLYLEGIGSFSVSGFVTTDGEELPKIDYTKPGTSQQTQQTLNYSDLKVGDILVCKSDRYKTFVKNGMYKIESLVVDKGYKLSFHNSQRSCLNINVPGAKSINRVTGIPTSFTVSLDKGILSISGHHGSYFNGSFVIKLNGHSDIKGNLCCSGWGTSGVYNNDTHYIKFFGIKRKATFKSWVFRKLTTEESRELVLGDIFEESTVKVITSSDKRNIELVDDKDDVLLKNLATAIIDPNRHHLSIVDWASTKSGDKLQIESKDYDPYLNMTLSEILQKIK